MFRVSLWGEEATGVVLRACGRGIVAGGRLLGRVDTGQVYEEFATPPDPAESLGCTEVDNIARGYQVAPVGELCRLATFPGRSICARSERIASRANALQCIVPDRRPSQKC